ncbi:unnamed protein product [Nezara viridula]|uniref:Neuropeptide n=1 Tax=Nezara viridula TaxID=85310 RepID=A0A9P0H9B9_NEZVI|nr:unnamed protein product [Nezara viridula]
MYGVLGVLLLIMGVYSALNDGLPWSRRVGRYKIELLPIAEEEYEAGRVRNAYPLAIGDSGPRNQSFKGHLRGQALVSLDKGKKFKLIGPSKAQNQNYDRIEMTIDSSGKPVDPGAHRRYVRTYGSWAAISAPVKSFINETFVKRYRRKRKKKRRKNGLRRISNSKITDPNLKNAYVRSIFGLMNGLNCTCPPSPEDTTRIRFILTPCECEADYEFTEPTESNELSDEETVEEGSSIDISSSEICTVDTSGPEENIGEESPEPLCTEPESIECETNSEQVQTDQCCQLDPMPKHTIDESRKCMCQMTDPTEEPIEDYATYKTFPFSGCKRKKKIRRPGLKHSAITVRKCCEPNLRRILTLPRSTKKSKCTDSQNVSKKKNEKSSKIKFSRKYSKPKRKNRVAHLKKKEVPTTYNIIKTDQTESLRECEIDSVLSRIKGRINTEESTINNVDSVSIESAEEVGEESENLGCCCGSNLNSARTEKSSSISTNAGLLDAMFKKFLGETEDGSSANWMSKDPPNKDESVTLIINVEDEVIAPPAVNLSMCPTNPLSLAVEEMLAEVKWKMTEAMATATTDMKMLTEVKWKMTGAFPTTTSETQTETGIITAEKLKHVKHRSRTTNDPSSKRGLICTNCFKYNYPSPSNDDDLISAKPVAETVTHHEASHCMELHAPEPNSDPQDILVPYPANEIPVTDADYDQIIDHIRCNFSNDEKKTTLDILKQICEDRYKSVTPSCICGSLQKETAKDNLDYDTQLDTIITQKTHHTESQTTKQQEDDYKESDTVLDESTRRLDTSQHTQRNSCTDEKTHIPMSISRKATTSFETTTLNDLDLELTSDYDAPVSAQTICFPISDFNGPEITTELHKTIKSSSVTKQQTRAEKTTPTLADEDSTPPNPVTPQTICFPVSDLIEPDPTTILRKTIKASSVTEQQETTTPTIEEGKTTKEDDKHLPPRPWKHSDSSVSRQTLCIPISDIIEPDTTTLHRKTVKASSVNSQQTQVKETIQEYEDTTKPCKEGGKQVTPRPCSCTQPSSTTHTRHHTKGHSHHYTLFFHHHNPSSEEHVPSSHQDITSSEGCIPCSNTSLMSSTDDLPSSHKDLPSTLKELPSSHKDLHSTHKEDKSFHKDFPSTHAEVAESSETGNEEGGDRSDNDVTLTTSKHTKTSIGKSGNGKLKPKKEKLKPQRFKFYPPLSLYRTWLSPWAAVQIKQPSSRNKPSESNERGHHNYKKEQHVDNLPHRPMTSTHTMIQSNIRTAASTNMLPNLGKSKGVYMGAIIVGNKYLPPGFYKLEDLKKLKNSGISIPKVVDKKSTAGNARIDYSLRRVLHLNRDRRNNKRKIINKSRYSKPPLNIYSMVQLPKGKIGRIVLDDDISNTMKDKDSETYEL